MMREMSRGFKSMPVMTEWRHGGSIVQTAVASSIYSLAAAEKLKFSFNTVALNYNLSQALEIMAPVSSHYIVEYKTTPPALTGLRQVTAWQYPLKGGRC